MAKDCIIVDVTKYKKSQRRQIFKNYFQTPGFIAFIKRSNSEILYEFYFIETNAQTKHHLL